MAVEAIEAPAAPKVDPSPAPELAPICPQHALEPAVRCRQCSAFYCPRCVPAHGKRLLCLSCNTTLAVRAAPERLRKIFRDLWISPLIMGLTVLTVSFVLIALSVGHPVIGVVFSIMAGAPFFLLALVIARTRSIAAAWISLVLELLCLFVLLGGGLSLWVLLAAIIPIITLFEIITAQELQDLMKAQPTA
ncbi:hypothetical protein [Hyalangium sp.]|uniref:hypothetical protein n=1 Tax=Hyalangium sp. TaxID=2028555 RepID=UPI002D5D1B96|nr:hypothetical protein [Hyalangium sp.]HYH99600.1 hypothetical protein [Hyalangium sp.]